MKLFASLNEELKQTPAGKYLPQLFRARGYRENFNASPVVFRANGVHALFSMPKPQIRPSELIAGNRLMLYAEPDACELAYAEKVVRRFGKRDFQTNNDHFAPYYERILSVGLPGLRNDVAASREAHRDDPARVETLNAMERTLTGFSEMISHYADRAAELREDPAYDPARLSFIEANCRALTERAPKTFAEALQLVWLCHTAFVMEGRGAMALGRIDQYLYPFYQADIKAGRTDDTEVVQLLENVFIRLQDDIYNICVGGITRKGEPAVNELSYLVVEAVKNCSVPGPNLSARITPETPDDFLDLCLRSIGTGLGYPALMNDTVNRAALTRYGYAEEDVNDYCMVGCIENFITGRQPPWSDGRFDTPRFFDFILNRGVSRFSDTIGLDTGDLSCLATMKDFVDALEKQIEYAVAEYCAGFRIRNDGINQKAYPDPFISCFCLDCIGRGLDINDGGAVYPSVHGVGLMGIATVSDSLAAVEKVVYIDHAATLEELRDALNANFEGFAELRKKLLEAPKYGNNDDFVDKYAVWFGDVTAKYFDMQKTRDGGGIYTAMASNTANISAGKTIGATPDGRLAGEPLSDAASPTYGRDVRGTTATMHSIAKPDYTKVGTGSVVNQKYSPAMFEDGKRQKLAAVIRTYFEKGGQEIQINATSPEILRDAMEHPEKYPTLVVRVSGYSAFYVTLDRDIQLDILSRTQKDE